MSKGFVVRAPTRNYYPPSRLRRVTKKNVCSVCGKPDWCSVTEDGAMALCMRVAAGSLRQAQNGAHIHILRPTWIDSVPAVSAPPIGRCGNAEVKRAGADHLHKVYSFLLEECLELRPEHGDHLLVERGLGDTVIASKLYASAPSKSNLPSVCEKMRGRFGDALLGVPGFYRDSRGVVLMPSYRGIFIPIRDERGRIVGLQCRSDGNGQAKYTWFSTNPDIYVSGTSSGTPVHYSKPDLVERRGKALLIEGALKADIVSEHLNMATVAVAGVSSFNADTFGADIQRSLPQLRDAMIAFDADWRTNEQVRGGLLRLIRSFKAAGLTIQGRVWDAERGKGLDDVLLNSDRSS